MKKIYIVLLLITNIISAQIPNGYYNSAQGLQGVPLKLALHNIIKNHNSVSYNLLYSHFADFDTLNGNVWDIYSHNPDSILPYIYHYISADQCGNYNGEGDCFNREHSWPQSWFNSGNIPTSDMFHIYPTDGYVNSIRSNLPYGNVGVANYTSMNNSKRGNCVTNGYSGIVFEPIDVYKGDLARSYFYMCTRYYLEDGSWIVTPMTNKSEINLWALAMLLQWHHNDTVSLKEVRRNEGIYNVQNNRNPFIDHPNWADSIWGPLVTKLELETKANFNVNIFPNPCTTLLNIQLNASSILTHTSIIFLNNLGEEVKQIKINNITESIDISNLNSGVYTLILRNNSAITVKKIVVL